MMTKGQRKAHTIRMEKLKTEMAPQAKGDLIKLGDGRQNVKRVSGVGLYKGKTEGGGGRLSGSAGQKVGRRKGEGERKEEKGAGRRGG